MSDSDSTPPDGFRQIPGFPRYAINENGTILSICTNGGNRVPWGEAKQLTPTKHYAHGYHVISLAQNGRKHQKRVHILVLEAFIGPRPDGFQCRHLDGNKDNNHASNLAWGTPRENQHDRFQHGTMCHRENHYLTTLTAADVAEIRRRAANDERQCDIAKAFSTAKYNVWRIINRLTWKHI